MRYVIPVQSFCGTGHWLSFGWDEADISTEIDGEGS